MQNMKFVIVDLLSREPGSLAGTRLWGINLQSAERKTFTKVRAIQSHLKKAWKTLSALQFGQIEIIIKTKSLRITNFSRRLCRYNRQFKKQNGFCHWIIKKNTTLIRNEMGIANTRKINRIKITLSTHHSPVLLESFLYPIQWVSDTNAK